jgi:hypothetical protein
VVGLGTQDSLIAAESFFRDYGPFTFPLLWDESGLSWSEIGITVQPAVALFRADGTLVDKWLGGIERAEALLADAGA